MNKVTRAYWGLMGLGKHVALDEKLDAMERMAKAAEIAEVQGHLADLDEIEVMLRDGVDG